MATVVKQSAVPQLVSAPLARVEVTIIASVEHVQTVQYVLGSVAVNDIEEDGDSHAMCSVNQLFQVVWKSVAATRSEEAVDLVPETGVVGVFHDSHQLDGIVSQVLDARESVGSELFVACNFGLGRRDSDVSFVDASTARLCWPGMLEDVALFLGRVPESGVVDGRNRQVLGDAGDPCWDALLTGMVVGGDEGNLE